MPGRHGGKDSFVRIVDAFLKVVDLAGLGFSNTTPNNTGRPMYPAWVMAGLLMVGYMKGVRSSRKLETLTHTDLEVMWLAEGRKPDFKTIADFRRNNTDAFEALFGDYVSFLDSLGLIGREMVAIDSTKIKASNSKKRYLSKKRLDQLITYNKTKAKECMEAWDKSEDVQECKDALNRAGEHTTRAQGYEKTRAELDKTGTEAIALTDSDARMVKTSSTGIDTALSVQTAVDDKTHIVTCFSVTNRADDHGQLAGMAQMTQETLRKKDLVFTADKGYFGSDDLKLCEQMGINAIVACPDKPHSKVLEAEFQTERFIYDEIPDTYLCPAGKALSNKSKSTTSIKSYSNPKACKRCGNKDRCVPESSNHRNIRRRPDSDILERAEARYLENKDIYKKRQQTVEHVFGTIKRSMNCGYLLLRGIPKAACEMALAFMGYNMKVSLNAVGFDALLEGLARYGEMMNKQRAVQGLNTSPFALNRALAALLRSICGLEVNRTAIINLAA